MTASITVSRRSAVKLVGGLMLAAGCTAALPGAAGAAEADEPLRVGVNGTPESALDPALGSASMAATFPLKRTGLRMCIVQ